MNDISAMKSEDLELFHYGIKGMKWGVRRKEGPDGNVGSLPENQPKPKTSRKEKRTAKRETKARTIEARVAKHDIQLKELNADLEKLPKNYKTMYHRQSLKTEINEQTKIRNSLQKDANAVRKGRLTRNQKLMLAGGIAVASVAGVMIYTDMKQSGQLNSLILRGEAFLKGQPFDFNKNPAFAKADMSADDVLKNVVAGLNPNYKNPGGAMNCRRVSYAYELRRRGYDVTATPSAVGWGQSESGVINALTPGKRNVGGSQSVSSMVVDPTKNIRSLIPGDKRSNPSTFMKNIKGSAQDENADLLALSKKTKIPLRVLINQRQHRNSNSAPLKHTDIRSALKELPDGARGEILFNFNRFGHSMSWEIFNGEPVIFDTQKNQKYSVDEAGIAQMFSKWGQSGEAEITRLDNIPLDKKFLARWATNTER